MLMSSGLSGNLRQKRGISLSYRVKFAGLNALDEGEYFELIKEAESSPLFCELKKAGIIRYRPFPGAGKFSVLPLEKDIPSAEQVEVEEFLEGRDKAVSLIRRIGSGKFKKYFLSGNCFTTGEMCRECGLSVPESEELLGFVDDFSVRDRFSGRSSSLNSPGLRVAYHKVGRIVEEDGRYSVEFYNLNDWRGRYSIDYEKLGRFREKRRIESEKADLCRLVSSLEMVNRRKKLLYQIVQSIIRLQRGYLDSGIYYRLRPLTLRKLAARLDACPSSVCRIIRNKTLELPRGGEKEIKFFFPNRKEVVSEYIRSRDGAAVSARILKEDIEKDLGLDIPARTVSYYREAANAVC